MRGITTLFGLLVIAGCAPAVEDECDGHDDCPREAPFCGVGGVCTTVAETEPGGDAAVARPPDGGCPPPGMPVFDDCNRVDDDCDGKVDEGTGRDVPRRACYEGPAGTEDRGECRMGFRTCDGGAWGRCREQRLPDFETCNGRDDDCDGDTDEGPDGGALVEGCYEGPRGTTGVGRCARGVRVCREGGQGSCEGQVLPGVEVCGGEDDDCDGAVDEDAGACVCGAGDAQACYSGPDGTRDVGVCRAGEQTCGGEGRFEACAGERRPDAEVCNGKDDDCDGEVDDVEGAGAPCAVGTGACRREGRLGCTGADEVLRCDARPGAPAEERCNRADDDCDGRADESLSLGAPCTVGAGACAAQGQRVCGPDGEVVCDATAGAPGEETCNGADDDCDGRTDEGPLSRSCFDGHGGARPGVGVCVAGRQTCAEGRWGPCEGAVGPGREVCDGLDNDCNGRVDDARGEGCACRAGDERDCYGGPAGTAGQGRCRAGRQRCDSGQWGPCEGERLPAPERCDGGDEDCDGAADEDFRVGEACAVGAGACGREGEWICAPDGGEVCGVEAGAPGAETCNGADDDCDGRADEDFPLLGSPCHAGEGACRRAGNLVCGDDGQPTCGAAPGPAADEACNGADDDCDGRTDEDFPVGEACAAEDACAGTYACDPAAGLVCATEPCGGEGG